METQQLKTKFQKDCSLSVFLSNVCLKYEPNTCGEAGVPCMLKDFFSLNTVVYTDYMCLDSVCASSWPHVEHFLCHYVFPGVIIIITQRNAFVFRAGRQSFRSDPFA